MTSKLGKERRVTLLGICPQEGCDVHACNRKFTLGTLMFQALLELELTCWIPKVSQSCSKGSPHNYV